MATSRLRRGVRSFKTTCRELVARANMLLDLFVFRRSLRFLGDKVYIPALITPSVVCLAPFVTH